MFTLTRPEAVALLQVDERKLAHECMKVNYITGSHHAHMLDVGTITVYVSSY